ncbi:hypothetical protein B0H10DRAFT_1962168 [Mycena sp. CBHHK59/15]|nr:hypothetical protein B0H10DRAFT_1962168 [Mycena sp. CBHHK59/15]
MSPTSSHLESIKKSKAALAHAARLKVVVVSSSDPDSSDSDNCHWDGTEGDKWGCEDGPLPLDNESSESDQDLEGLELLRSFALAGNNDKASIVTAYQAITEYKSEKNWKEAEKKLKGQVEDKEEEDKISRTRVHFRYFLRDSDDPMREGQDQTSGMDSADEIIAAKAVANLGEEPLGHRVQPVPALRHTKLGIPQAEHHHIAMAQAATARANILASALTEINKLIASKKDIFHAGSLSLQSYRVRAIQSHHMVVRNRKSWKPASETAADAQGFAMQWGRRKVRKWTCSWISTVSSLNRREESTASHTRFMTTL